MAAFLRRQSMRISSLSAAAMQRSRCLLRGGAFLRTAAEGGRRRCRDGALLSSWTGGDGDESYQPYRRSKFAVWGDWFSLGLVVLMGGVFWTSRPSDEEKWTRSVTVTWWNLLVAYEALKYSLKRRLHVVEKRGPLMRRIQRFRDRRVELQAHLQDVLLVMKCTLIELEDILDDLEDARLQDPEKGRRHRRRREQFHDSAVRVLQRIEDLKHVLAASPGTDDPNMTPPIILSPEETAELVRELSETQAVVWDLMERYAEIETLIIRNKEVIAEMDEALRECENMR